MDRRIARINDYVNKRIELALSKPTVDEQSDALDTICERLKIMRERRIEKFDSISSSCKTEMARLESNNPDATDLSGLFEKSSAVKRWFIATNNGRVQSDILMHEIRLQQLKIGVLQQAVERDMCVSKLVIAVLSNASGPK